MTTNKASRSDGIPAELFKILKDNAVRVLHSYASNFGKLSRAHRTGNGQFSFQSQRRATPNNVQTTIQLCSFHMLARLCPKSFKARLQQYVNRELRDVQAEFRKGWEARDQIATYTRTQWNQGNFRKTSTSASLTLKPLTVWITTNCGKFLKRWEYQTTLPVSWET